MPNASAAVLTRRQTFSLRADLPGLNAPSFLYTTAHLVSDLPGLAYCLPASAIDTLLEGARAQGWSVNLLDPNPRKLILTFDDGRRFSDDLAAVLDRHDATAIFFVCTERETAAHPNDSPVYWELLPENRRYIAERHVVGGHTDRHVDLRATPADRQYAVLDDSARAFEAEYGFRPWCFAYPWGRYRSATFAALRAHRVRYAFVAGAGRVGTDDLLIPRVLLDGGDWPAGDFDHLLRRRAGAVENAKLLLRNGHLTTTGLLASLGVRRARSAASPA